MTIMAVKADLKRLWSRYEFVVVLFIGALFAVMGLLESNYENGFFGTYNTLKAPHMASILGFNQSGGILHVLIPFLATFPCAWYYHSDQEHHLVPLLLSRMGRYPYFVGRALAVSLSSFVVVVFPYLINLILSLLAYPLPAYGLLTDGVYDLYPDHFATMQKVLFPELFLNQPILHALLIIFLIGIYGALMGLLSYSITLYFRKNMATTMLLTTVLSFASVFLLNVLRLSDWNIHYHLTVNYSCNTGMLEIVAIEFLILFLINVGMIAGKVIVNKDVLR